MSGRRPASTWHRLTDVDLPRRVATCSVCGPGARLYVRATRTPVCMAPRLKAKALAERKVQTRQDRYGLPGAVAELLKSQGGTCAICAREITLETVEIDHDHACCPSRGRSCGQCVRGLLCKGCNSGLGYFRDDPQSLLAAVAYLVSPPGVRVLDVPTAS